MRRRMGPDFIFLQDNPHPINNIKLLSHPANSPDRDTIEHVWDMMDRILRWVCLT